MPKTLRFDATTKPEVILDAIRRELLDDPDADGALSISMARDSETMSPQQAADFLGISRQHLMRLLDAGLLPFTRKPNSSHRTIPSRAVAELAAARQAGKKRIDKFAATMNDAGVFE
jgi:excisionase family DNA binding protein